MRSGVVISIVLSLFVVALAVLPAAAQDRLDAVVAAVDRATTPAAAEAAAVDRMAKFLDTTPDVLRGGPDSVISAPARAAVIRHSAVGARQPPHPAEARSGAASRSAHTGSARKAP